MVRYSSSGSSACNEVQSIELKRFNPVTLGLGKFHKWTLSGANKLPSHRTSLTFVYEHVFTCTIFAFLSPDEMLLKRHGQKKGKFLKFGHGTQEYQEEFDDLNSSWPSSIQPTEGTRSVLRFQVDASKMECTMSIFLWDIIFDKTSCKLWCNIKGKYGNMNVMIIEW